MSKKYIGFFGEPRDLEIAVKTFEVVLQLNYNARPLKSIRKNYGVVIEYPAFTEFNAFYREALNKLLCSDYNGRMPRIATPA